MRRLQCALLAAVAFVGFASLASAADLPTKAPVYKARAVAPINWTGCYVGIEAGYGWGRSPNTDPDLGGSEIATTTPRGGLVGGTLGCNWQTNNWVFGVENDLSWTGFNASAANVPPFNPLFTQNTKTTWLDTLRGRAGIAVDRWLLYVTGGVAFANITDSSTGPTATVSNTYTAPGWTVGAGAEWAMPDTHWSIKAEYLYADFGSHNNNFPAQNALFVNTNTHLKENIVRLGVNYHFW